MRVLVLTYSLTRCTLRVADELCRLLRLAGHEATQLDVVPHVRRLVQQQQQQRAQAQAQAQGQEPHRDTPGGPADAAAALDASLAPLLRSADALGVATMTWCFREPPGLLPWLRLAASACRPGAPAFVVATAGQHAAACPARVARALGSCGLRVVDRLVVRSPDTFLWYAPWRPARMLWGSGALAPCAPFVAALEGRLLGSAAPVPRADLESCGLLARLLSLLPYEAIPLLTGVPAPTRACTRCGVCARGCPAGAIALREGRVAVDAGRCLGCTRCVALCPVGAMQAPASQGRSLYVWCGRSAEAPDGRPDNWTWLQMQGRFLHTALFLRPWATARAVAATLAHVLGFRHSALAASCD
eukprot:m51a1_g6092 hypothetical protein (358) ;mRNA; f:35827-37045